MLEYRGDLIELRGETVLGRGLECGIRFNDPTVSRNHARLRVEADGVTVEDLDSSNGTAVNGQRISGVQRLKDGDTLLIGNRSLGVRIGAARDDGRRIIVANVGDPMMMPTVQTCPRCRALVPIRDEVCGECAFRWSPGRPLSPTAMIPESGDRRRSPRVLVDIPGLYVSPLITCDANATDLSRGGVFVLTEIVDAASTPCQIILLPDGIHPTPITGVVRRVAMVPGNGHPLGMGIEFLDVDEAAAAAINSLLAP